MIWRFDFQPRSLVWLMAIALAAGIGLRGIEWFRHRPLQYPLTVVHADPAGTPVSKIADSILAIRRARESGPVRINTATASEFESLPGIGPVLAAAIVNYRASHGPFASVGELENVSGIGPKRLAAIVSRCVLDSALDSSAGP